MKMMKEMITEMNYAINEMMNVKPWDLTKAEQKALSLCTETGIMPEERVGRVCDALTTFGLQNDEKFNGFFALINELPEND